MPFTDKIILITGASSGIGAATAIHLAKLGGSLVLTGRNAANLKKVSDQCEKEGILRPHEVIISDVTSEKDTKQIIDETIKKFNRLDILINNAGTLDKGSIKSSTLEQLDRMYKINVRAVYHITKLAVPHLMKTKGNIVNVSSLAGSRAFPGILAYSVTKAAIDHFTKCIALELAPYGIRVNGVNPGVIHTEGHKREGMDESEYQKFLERSKMTHALGRPGEAEEVASAIAFLASDAASFTTGERVHIDGGRHAMCPRE